MSRRGDFRVKRTKTAFDLKLDGQSWMDYIAARGYDVYLLDVRGYGKSTRPREMSEKAIPDIIREVEKRRLLAAESRHRQLEMPAAEKPENPKK